MRKRGYDVVEVDQAETDAYNAALQQRMKRTVWTPAAATAGTSTRTAATPTLWPRSTLDFRRRLASFDRGLHA